MTRRWLLLGLAILATAVAGSMVLLLTAPRHRINEDSVKLIQNGMTQAEIEVVFGVPPGDYSSGGLRVYWEEPQKRLDRKEWTGDAVGVEVFFDPSGKVQAVDQYQVFPFPSEPLLAKLRRWLGL